MNVVDYLLDGLEAELELERELGVRSLEIDRTLLSVPALPPSSHPAPDPAPSAAPASAPTPTAPPAPAPAPARAKYDFVFVHDRPLTPQAVEMMAKILTAMGKTPETAPIVVAPPIPQAKSYVMLGQAALRRYMPDVRAQEGVWFTSPKGKAIMLVKSPEEILRFDTVSPAVVKMKQDMWRALKIVMQRVGRDER